MKAAVAYMLVFGAVGVLMGGAMIVMAAMGRL